MFLVLASDPRYQLLIQFGVWKTASSSHQLYLFQEEVMSFFLKKRTNAKILQELLANEVKLCYPYIYHASSATSKSNLGPSFNFIKVLK
jgi:hypothetical protein